MNRRLFLKSSAVAGASLTRISSLLSKDKPKESWFCKALAPKGKRILEHKGWNVWGCSPIYVDGKVHVFFSRWPGGHENWLSKSEIAHAVADHPEGPYTVIGTVLKGRGDGWWDAHTIHNPTIHKVGEQYAIFYIGNNLNSADKHNMHHAGTQRIGLIVANSIYGSWERVSDEPIINTSNNPRSWDSYLTTNPAFLRHPNGQCWLYYKAWDRNNDNLRKTGVAFSDQLEGPYQKYEKNPTVDFSNIGAQTEDSYVFYHNNKFHMIIRDMGVIDPRVGLYLSSQDGLTWSKPQLGYHKSNFYFDEPVQRFERPQILIKDGKPDYLFCALMGGQYNTSSGAVIKLNL